MKRIVICCDGTWKRLDAPCPTNVVKLARAVRPRGADGMAQVVLHLDGVGTGRGTGALARAIDRGLGGAFGLGLMATLETAYRFLMFNYEPGDEIYLLGFSRGAYTARSLVGLMRNCGILRREHTAQIGRALALYRARGSSSHPDAAKAQAFRARYAVRGSGGREAPLAVRYLGVWDTVGALGVPAHLALSRLCNRGLGFHDTRLSGMVWSARHAVAIDERRRTFPPALWDNLDERNRSGPGRYRQCWFPGDHASVGGGGDVTALSNGAGLWIAEGAAAAGLGFDASVLADLVRGSNCLGPLRATSPRAWNLGAALLERSVADREGPEDARDLAPSAMRRWRCDAGYRPATLARLAVALEQVRPLRRAG